MAGRGTNLWPVVALLLVVVGLPLAVVAYQARRTGLPLGAFLRKAFARMDPQTVQQRALLGAAPRKGAKIQFLEPRPIGDPVAEPPRIAHLTCVDLDRDTLLDVVVCDALLDRVRWVRQAPAGVFTELDLGDPVRTPAHVEADDIDQDGDLDLLVASMGMLFPNNDRIGAVIVLENDGQQGFRNRVLLDGVARVTDIRAGDLDGDGDQDLAVGQFGYDDGEIRWMENRGDWTFESHMLLRLSGCIHTPVVDIDQDGDLDIVALVSQEWEELYVFRNDGQGRFQTRLVYGSTNEDFGSSGISVVDFDRDGDPDVLYTNGDAFDYLPPGPRPWHGVQWLENQGDLRFAFHRIADVPGAYSAQAVDADRDGDLDLFVVSAFNKWSDPAAQSFVWFENQGEMVFVQRDIASSPTHLLVLDAADLDGDGWDDFVTGGMHVYPPNDRMSRIVWWRNRWPSANSTTP